jgi:hypothetical protein
MNEKHAKLGDKIICISSAYNNCGAEKNNIYIIKSIDFAARNCKIEGITGVWGYPIESSHVFRLYENNSEIYIKKSKIRKL